MIAFAYRLNAWLVGLCVLALLLAAVQIGSMIGRRVQSRTREKADGETTTIQAATLGLLALLLGFSFSMAMTRYDMRRDLVVEEANAIGTTYLRSKMLQDPQKSEIARLLRGYVDVRIAFYKSRMDREAYAKALSETDRLQRALWTQATAAVRVDPKPVPTGLFVDSLNNVIDDHEKRVAAMENQVPEPIFLILYGVAILSFGLTGYACGLAGKRNRLLTATTAIPVALVVYMVTDLDQPRQGLIRVSQQSMVRLQDTLRREAR